MKASIQSGFTNMFVVETQETKHSESEMVKVEVEDKKSTIPESLQLYSVCF